MKIRNIARRLLFPGFDIHTRSRSALCKHWDVAGKTVLDAGCGNGYFSKLAIDYGAKKVVGTSFEDKNTQKAKVFFKKEIDKGRMEFRTANLYNLEADFPAESFDAIICYEVVEHLMDDQKVVNSFYRLLKPGGVLHLCAPNKLHPVHDGITPSATEDGWHVRKGYDEADFRNLVEKAGFSAQAFTGIGNEYTFKTDHFVRKMRKKYGHAPALPLFAVANMVSKIAGHECKDLTKAFSIYVKAVKLPT